MHPPNCLVARKERKNEEITKTLRIFIENIMTHIYSCYDIGQSNETLFDLKWQSTKG
jgi:hypothetical protein